MGDLTGVEGVEVVEIECRLRGVLGSGVTHAPSDSINSWWLEMFMFGGN